MNATFEAQLISSLNEVNRRHSRREGVVTAFNLLILMLGFAFVAAGYVISQTPRERLADYLGVDEGISIERPASAASIRKSAGNVSKTLLGLLG